MLDLPMVCAGCGADVSEGARGVDWFNYDGLLVACAACMIRDSVDTARPTNDECTGRNRPGEIVEEAATRRAIDAVYAVRDAGGTMHQAGEWAAREALAALREAKPKAVTDGAALDTARAEPSPEGEPSAEAVEEACRVVCGRPDWETYSEEMRNEERTLLRDAVIAAYAVERRYVKPEDIDAYWKRRYDEQHRTLHSVEAALAKTRVEVEKLREALREIASQIERDPSTAHYAAQVARSALAPSPPEEHR